MRDHDEIAIVGAGPAGLSCAIVLARAGARVIVREWKDRVGHRFHDDFQGLENWTCDLDVIEELGAAGIAADFDYHPFDRGIIFDPTGRQHDIRGKRPLFYLLRRGPGEGTLDSALLFQARAAGVEVRFCDRVQTFYGAGILAAGPREADVIAAGHVFDTDMPDGAWLALGHEVAPGGYAYLLVRGGRGTVASCMFTDFHNQSRHVEAAEEFFRAHAGLKMHNRRAFGGYGAYRWPRSASQGGHPMIGEHAGFQDALAGFGLRYTIRSGVLAAECLLAGRDYTVRWQSELGTLLEAGIVNRWMFGLGGEFGMRIVCHKLAEDDARDILRRAYDLTAFKRLALPLARRRYRKMLEDRSCSHVNCVCVWCRHGDHGAGGNGVREGEVA